MDEKTIWCPLAFNGILCKTTGEFKTCCAASKQAVDSNQKKINRQSYTLEQAFNADFFKKIRNNLRSGVKDSNCDRCWREEEIGVESYRQKQIKKFGHKFSDDNIKYVDLALGNQCNLKCRICRLDDSTQWIKETWESENISSDNLKDFIILKTKKSPQNFIDNIKNELINQVNFLSFFGGEPFLIKSTWEILDFAVQKKVANNIDLLFNTNGTIWTTEKQNILSNFKSVDLHLSIDGIEQKFNYTRHPAKWDTFLKNLKKIILWKERTNIPINLVLDYSVSNYNVYDAPEFIVFCNKMNLQYYFNIVVDPEYLCISNLPTVVKECIKEHFVKCLHQSEINGDEMQKIIGYLNQASNKENNLQEFFKEIDKRDVYRNESFKNTFRDYFNIINSKNPAI